jgi:hypothetical protein
MSNRVHFPFQVLPAARRGRFAAGFGAIVAIVANCTFATETTTAHRYELAGAGALALDPPVQRSGSLHLKAALSPGVVAIDAPAMQSDGRFALSATFAASSLVCYNDTIFRDDFDADGF